MNKPKAYIETTMFNYCFDEERDAHNATVAFFEAVKAGRFEAYTSHCRPEEVVDYEESEHD